METKITQGIFIRLMEESDESTKLSKIFSIAGGNELYKKFEVIELFKAKQNDNIGREIYKIVVTVEYAYDSLNLIEKYCDTDRTTGYGRMNLRGPYPKHYINPNPKFKEYEAVPMDQQVLKLKIKDMDFYDIAEITNNHWSTKAYNLFLRKSHHSPLNSKSSVDYRKFWFIPRAPNGDEFVEILKKEFKKE